MSVIDQFSQAFETSVSGLAFGALSGYALDRIFHYVPHATNATNFPIALLGVIAQISANQVILSEFKGWADARSTTALGDNELAFYFAQFATQPSLQRRIRSIIQLMEYAVVGASQGNKSLTPPAQPLQPPPMQKFVDPVKPPLGP
jgi:hypothetical protein